MAHNEWGEPTATKVTDEPVEFEKKNEPVDVQDFMTIIHHFKEESIEYTWKL